MWFVFINIIQGCYIAYYGDNHKIAAAQVKHRNDLENNVQNQITSKHTTILTTL